MVLPESSFFIIPTIFSLIVMVTVLMAKKGRKAKRPNAELTGMDKINQISADIRTSPDPSKYEITPSLLAQFISNFCKREKVPHTDFPVDRPDTHMNSVQIAKFAAIKNSFPWTCAAHDSYIVKDGVVCYRDDNKPVSAEVDLVKYVAEYEGSGGRLPKLNLFREELRRLDEENDRNGKWDYSRGIPPR